MAVTVPRYERRVGTPNATTAVFANPRPLQIGAAVTEDAGNAAQNIGQQMAAAQNRISGRLAAVERTRLRNEMRTYAADTLANFETERDISQPATVTEYRKLLQQKGNELLGKYSGTLDGRTALEGDILDYQSQYEGTLAGRAIAAQRAMVKSGLDEELSSISSLAYEDPQGYDGRVEQLGQTVAGMADALSPEEQRAYEIGGRAELAASTINGMLDRGDFDNADAFMARPDVAEVTSPDQMRRFRSRMTLQRLEDERAANAGLRQIQAVEQMLGRKVTQSERMQLAGLAPNKPVDSVAAKIAAFEAATGQTATPAQIAKAYGMEVESADPENPFGSGLQGRALASAMDLAPLYEAGLTSPEEERRLEAAMAAMRVTDPITGQPVVAPPPFLAKALAARGIDPVQAFDGQVSIVGARPGADGGGLPPGAMPASFGQSQQQPAPAPAAPNPQSIFNQAENIAGPVPFAAEVLRSNPIFGAIMPGADMLKARQSVELAQQNLVRVLQNSPRYAEGERQAIAKEVDISPAIWSNPEAYRDKLIAIDDGLRQRLAVAEQTAKSRTVSQEERAKATDLVNAIVPFLEQLGVPPVVQTPEEAWSLPVGTMFRTPKGEVFVVPPKRGPNG